MRIRDEFEGDAYEQTVTLDPAARSVLIQGPMGYEATWRAVPADHGTRVSVEGRMGKGILGSLMKLFEKRMRKSMEADSGGTWKT